MGEGPRAVTRRPRKGVREEALMVKRGIVLGALFVVCSAVPALAQIHLEVSGFYGYTWSDGVETDQAIVAGDGNIYDSVDPKSGQSYGFMAGVLPGDNAEFGFLFSHQSSALLLNGTTETEVGDLGIDTYAGYFAYNFGESGGKVRPFVFVGFGATHFGGV